MSENNKIHPTAIIESGVILGEGTSVWDNVHIRRNTQIGRHCIIGGKSLIAYEVRIGDFVKINSNVYVCYGVTLENGVMVGAGVIFTNDRFPRATNPELNGLRDSDLDEHTLKTRVCEGASIGAGAIIGCNLTIGRFAMVGMGTVVTRDVKPFHLVVGSPGRTIGIVCRCGPPVGRVGEMELPSEMECRECGRRYHVDEELNVREC
ncbi:MAG: acyltransferase [Pirellulaceae bacterium]